MKLANNLAFYELQLLYVRARSVIGISYRCKEGHSLVAFPTGIETISSSHACDVPKTTFFFVSRPDFKITILISLPKLRASEIVLPT